MEVSADNTGVQFRIFKFEKNTTKFVFNDVPVMLEILSQDVHQKSALAHFV
jgi:hypothetical protein